MRTIYLVTDHWSIDIDSIDAIDSIHSIHLELPVSRLANAAYITANVMSWSELSWCALHAPQCSLFNLQPFLPWHIIHRHSVSICCDVMYSQHVIMVSNKWRHCIRPEFSIQLKWTSEIQGTRQTPNSKQWLKWPPTRIDKVNSYLLYTHQLSSGQLSTPERLRCSDAEIERLKGGCACAKTTFKAAKSMSVVLLAWRRPM